MTKMKKGPLSFLGAFLLAMAMTSLVFANDGVFDANDDFPEVGTMGVITSDSGELDPDYTLGGVCSGSLIAPNLFLTAAHCAYFDGVSSTRLIERFVSFDSIVSDNDLFCYMQDSNHPNKDDVVCDEDEKNDVTFIKVISVAAHPDYDELLLQGDLAIFLLETPVAMDPLDLAPPALFDDIKPFIGLPMTGVGYGWNWSKSIPARPRGSGLGPTTELGPRGVRRIADVGFLKNIHKNWLVPTEQSSQGEDAICYEDSGSPIFFRDNEGAVDKTVLGVLSWGAGQHCIGAENFWTRVDTPQAVSFISCVKDATSAQEMCECGLEDELGLCD